MTCSGVPYRRARSTTGMPPTVSCPRSSTDDSSGRTWQSRSNAPDTDLSLAACDSQQRNGQVEMGEQRRVGEQGDACEVSGSGGQDDERERVVAPVVTTVVGGRAELAIGVQGDHLPVAGGTAGK